MSRHKPSTTPHRRRRCYIDRALQGPLLAALLLFELLLLVGALLALQHNLSAAIEEQIYRAHQLPTSSNPLLIRELAWVSLWLVGINVAAIMLMGRLWSGMVRRVVDPLQRLLLAVARLDLRPQDELCGEHQVLRQAEAWLRHERERCTQLQAIAARLDGQATPDHLRHDLLELRQLLPRNSRGAE